MKPVEVKSLPWVGGDFSDQAKVTEIGLTYTLQNGRDGWFAAVTGAGISLYLDGHFATREECQSVAQADFEKRIFSLLRFPT